MNKCCDAPNLERNGPWVLCVACGTEGPRDAFPPTTIYATDSERLAAVEVVLRVLVGRVRELREAMEDRS